MECFKKGTLSEKEIVDYLFVQREKAYVPISGFKVGAVARVRFNGEDYYCSGVNVEYNEHRLSTHGEEGAISVMLSTFGRMAKIEELWVVGGRSDSPKNIHTTCCGKCRQQLSTYCEPDVKIHYLNLNREDRIVTMAETLPDAFSYKSNDIAKSIEHPFEAIRNKKASEAEIRDWMRSFQAVDFIGGIGNKAVFKLDSECYVAGVSADDAAFINISSSQAAAAVAMSEFGELHLQGAYFQSDLRVSDREFVIPSLAELMIVREFSKDNYLPCTIFTSEERVVHKTLDELCSLSLASHRRVFRM